MELAIGVVTYNRLPALAGCVASCRKFTSAPHVLMVADDGSTDGVTPAWLEEQKGRGVRVLGGRNRRPAWNRNRILWEFLVNTDCSTLIMLDDDCWPASEAWEQHWKLAATMWAYVAHAYDGDDGAMAGNGSHLKPWLSTRTAGNAIAVSRSALLAAGFQDTAYKDGWGFEDSDWSLRFMMQPALLAIINARLGIDPDPAWVLGIRHGIEVQNFGTHTEWDRLDRNREISEQLRSKPLYRLPWSNEEERADFLSEFPQPCYRTETTPAP